MLLNWLKSKLPQRFVDFVVYINPCEGEDKDDNSIIWRIISTIFPECWCCAGLRGIVYGIVLTLSVMYFL